MRPHTLILAGLACAALVPLARAEKRIQLAPQVQPPANAPATKLAPSDPVEPPVKVEATQSGDVGARALQQAAGALEVSSGARGTTLKLTTLGGYAGSAKLTFKTAAPPMRFTLKLARLPAADLSSLTLTSGSLTLALGGVSTSATTKYFDARGREQATAHAAAYTIRASRADNGEVDIQVRRGPGAALDKSLGLSWQSNHGLRMLGGRGRFVER